MWKNYIGVTQDVGNLRRRVSDGKWFAKITCRPRQMHRSQARIRSGHRRVACPVTLRHNGPVTSGKRAAAGRHAGPARLDEPSAPPPRPRRSRATGPLLLLALGITAAVVAWGYLVYLAIDFGTTARNGDGRAWWFLAMATIGAIACLFLGMMLGVRLLARVRAEATPPAPPRPPGGRRAAR